MAAVVEKEGDDVAAVAIELIGIAVDVGVPVADAYRQTLVDFLHKY